MVSTGNRDRRSHMQSRRFRCSQCEKEEARGHLPWETPPFLASKVQNSIIEDQNVPPVPSTC